MSDALGTVQNAVRQVAPAFEPLTWVLTEPETLRAFLEHELGFAVPETLTSVGIDPARVAAVISALDALGGELARPTPDSAALTARSGTLAASITSLAEAVVSGPAALGRSQGRASPQAARLADELPTRLLDWLLIERLLVGHMSLFQTLVVLGIVEFREVSADARTFTSAHTRRSLRLDRLARLLADPTGWLRDVYGWGTPQAELSVLIERVFALAVTLGLPATLGRPLPELEAGLSAPVATSVERLDAPVELRMPILCAETIGSTVEAGIVLVALQNGPARQHGIALLPYADGTVRANTSLDARGRWNLALEGTLDARAGFGVVARPHENLRLVTDPLGAGAAGTGEFTAQLARLGAARDRIALLTFPGIGAVSVQSITAQAGVRVASATDSELWAECGVTGGLLRTDFGAADGFLRSLVSEELQVRFDLSILLSSLTGIHIKGGAGLHVTRQCHLQLGPVRLEAITLGCSASDRGLDAVAAINLGAHLGPVTVTLQRVGIASALSVRETGGNLGALQLDARFEPPRGAGLSIEAGPVTGAGFLDFNPEAGEYSGGVQLRFGVLSLAAVGLISTRLPDGRPGFSMLVVISAEFGAVQLGFGFTLNAVGGLLGINRSAAVEPLRAGVRDRSLGSVLFPRDVARNASRVLSDLRSLFPVAEGRHVLGPMARLGWGTPTIVSLELGVILELPSPLRLIILGRLRMTLPTAQAPVATINMDAVGIIDFGTGEVSVDATIYDSLIGPFALSGDMALRARFREQPAFALAIGGFHPRFEPPAGFPELRRIALALATSENPRVRLEAYLALTSNTLQVGARLDVYAAVEVLGRWSVEAYLLFDALFEFSPFHFEVDIAAGVTLKRDGAVMFAVDLSLRISGPSPWRAIGEASFTFLGRHSVHVEVTAGQDAPPAQIEPADVARELVAALSDSRNWNAELPTGPDATVVTLRRRPLEDGAVVAHPLGALVVRQRVAPLERVITKFGNTRPREERAYRITAAALGGPRDGVPMDGVQEHFAPAQFFSLSEEEKLSRPSFELMPAGVRLAAGERAQWGFAASVDLEYETILVDRAQNQRHRQEVRFVLSQDALVGQAAFGAAAQAETRSSGAERFAVPANPVVLRDPSFAVADTAEMAQAPRGTAGDRGATYSEARAELERLAAGRADRGEGLQVVAAHEVISA